MVLQLCKAAMLQTGADYIRQLQAERSQLRDEMDSLRQQIECLNTAIRYLSIVIRVGQFSFLWLARIFWQIVVKAVMNLCFL
jgi:hypothetical protein